MDNILTTPQYFKSNELGLGVRTDPNTKKCYLKPKSGKEEESEDWPVVNEVIYKGVPITKEEYEAF